ncbi:hypothetical protein [Brevundimonas sp.]|uniref:hypothetical protein n=1 Tax=Brevundimonas sp. TaxID=1871086 RepID=UPI00391BBAA7
MATAVSTAAIAILTWNLVRENRALREQGASPDIVAYLAPHSEGNGAVEFVLSNVGNGPAYDVRFDFICDEDDFEKHEVMLTNDHQRMPTSVIPPGEKIVSLMGVGYVLYGGKKKERIEPLKPFDVRISYKNRRSQVFNSSRTIDIRQFSGLKGILAKSTGAKTVDHLDAIQRHLGTIAKRSHQVVALVETTEMKNEYRTRSKGEG